MQLTNRQVVESFQALTAMSRERLPIKAAFVIGGRNLRCLQKANEDYDKARLVLVNQHAKKDEAGKPVESQDQPGNIQLEDPAAFAKEINDLLNFPVELAMYTVNIADLGSEPLPVQYFYALDWMIVEGVQS